MGHDWRSKDELISGIVFIWLTSKESHTLAPCSLEDLPGVLMIGMDDERESGNSVLSARLDDDIYRVAKSNPEIPFDFVLPCS